MWCTKPLSSLTLRRPDPRPLTILSYITPRTRDEHKRLVSFIKDEQTRNGEHTRPVRVVMFNDRYCVSRHPVGLGITLRLLSGSKSLMKNYILQACGAPLHTLQPYFSGNLTDVIMLVDDLDWTTLAANGLFHPNKLRQLLPNFALKGHFVLIVDLSKEYRVVQGWDEMMADEAIRRGGDHCRFVHASDEIEDEIANFLRRRPLRQTRLLTDGRMKRASDTDNTGAVTVRIDIPPPPPPPPFRPIKALKRKKSDKDHGEANMKKRTEPFETKTKTETITVTDTDGMTVDYVREPSLCDVAELQEQEDAENDRFAAISLDDDEVESTGPSNSHQDFRQDNKRIFNDTPLRAYKPYEPLPGLSSIPITSHTVTIDNQVEAARIFDRMQKTRQAAEEHRTAR